MNISVGKSKRDRPLEIPACRCRWEDDIKMDLKEWCLKAWIGNLKGLEPNDVDCIQLPQVKAQYSGGFANTVMKLRVP
jgi:hypothetical protein